MCKYTIINANTCTTCFRKISCSFTDSNSNKLFSERRSYQSKDDSKVKVEMFRTIFTDFKDENDGGGIYVDNSKDQQNHINLDHFTFISCRAGYGCAIYIYSQYETNPIEIRSCTFQSNEAYGEENDNNWFGGSAIFVNAKYTKILRCRFADCQGLCGSVEILDNFDSNSY